MKQEIKEKWIANLRSGNYKKTTGKLKTNPKTKNKECKYCAMGVLVDMYINSNDNCRWYGNNLEVDGKVIITENLPTAVQEWAGISSDSGMYKNNHSSVIRDNDGYKLSFAKIADKLETVELL